MPLNKQIELHQLFQNDNPYNALNVE